MCTHTVDLTREPCVCVDSCVHFQNFPKLSKTSVSHFFNSWKKRDARTPDLGSQEPSERIDSIPLLSLLAVKVSRPYACWRHVFKIQNASTIAQKASFAHLGAPRACQSVFLSVHIAKTKHSVRIVGRETARNSRNATEFGLARPDLS